MYRYAFSFTMKLTITLLQRVATFYMWKVKQKDGGINRNTFDCCYGYYVTTNQLTKINKSCWPDFTSLPCHSVFKSFSKVTICYCISLRLVKVSSLEI